jgi:hypothetical protein
LIPSPTIAITGVDKLFRRLFDLASSPSKSTLFVGVFDPVVGVDPPLSFKSFDTFTSFKSFDPFSSFKSWSCVSFILSIAILCSSLSLSCRLYASIKDAAGVTAGALPFSFAVSPALCDSPPHSRARSAGEGPCGLGGLLNASVVFVGLGVPAPRVLTIGLRAGELPRELGA